MPRYKGKGSSYEREICRTLSEWWSAGQRDDKIMKYNGKEVTEKDICYFWSRVDIRSSDECWEWQAGKNSTKPGFNYGCLHFKGKPSLAHRIAFSLHHGRWLDAEQVLHSCDNPPCCNPKHLRKGTHADNMKDKAAKGRCNCEKGTDRYSAVLNDNKVRRIRKLHKRCFRGKYGTTYFAKLYKVDPAVIKGVAKRKKWKHVED